LTDNATTIHWHGIRQIGTNDQDGVPGVTECGLAPGDSRVYEFKASSYGSSWYHSHFITQFADGVQGPMIIKGPTSANYDVDMGTVMISDL
jgi:FtsP/CotA-like multicopper oxidase with cupredoxin domain